MHNYEVKGHPKVKVITLITIVAVMLSTWLNLSIDLLENIMGMPISVTVSSVAVAGVLYFIFSKYVWKWELFRKIFEYPDFNGSYSIVGKSIKKTTDEIFDWEGLLFIKQDWDKILISMKSKNSSSESKSVSGSVEYQPMKGYELTYTYENTPNNNVGELHKHNGTCTIIFEEDLDSATGNYYNDMKNRENYGRMDLRKIYE